MLSIKINFNNETRRAQYGEEPCTFYGLQCVVKAMFPVLTNECFALRWLDDEGDTIFASSDIEVNEAVRVMRMQFASGAAKFQVVTTDSRTDAPDDTNHPFARPPPTLSAVHNMVICDGCQQNPIIGVRYKCTVREDFDLCERCETRSQQPHAMVKIYQPHQAPAALFYAFHDDADANTDEEVANSAAKGPNEEFAPEAVSASKSSEPFTERAHRKLLKKADKLHRKMAKHQSRLQRIFGNSSANAKPAQLPHASALADIGEFGDCFDVADALPPDLRYQAIDCDLHNAVSEASVERNDAFPVSQPAKDHSELPEDLYKVHVDSTLLVNPMTSQSQTSEDAQSVSELSQLTAFPSMVSQAREVQESPAFDMGMRLVRHITYPDGTLVQPESVFNKIWRVQNSGTAEWPSDTQLVGAGGDVMSATDVRVHVGALPPTSEVEVSCQLTAPEEAGRHVSFFRLESDGETIGARVWVDVTVAELETDWQYVARSIHASNSRESSVDDSVPSCANTDEQQSSAQGSTVVDVPIAILEDVQAPVDTSISGSEVSQARSLAEELAEIKHWKAQLLQLAEMGFTDIEVILPLLQEHMRSNESAEGLVHVVTALLNTL